MYKIPIDNPTRTPISAYKGKKCISGQNRVQPPAMRMNQPDTIGITNRSQLVKLQSAALSLLSFPPTAPALRHSGYPSLPQNYRPLLVALSHARSWTSELPATGKVVSQPGTTRRICVARVLIVWPLNFFFFFQFPIPQQYF